jgi:hypothetical protein
MSCRRAEDTGELVSFDFPQIRFDETLEALLPYRPAVVCAMHSPIDSIAPAIAAIAARWSGPIGAYPEIDAAATTPQQLASLADEWRERGAQVLGGCCGTTPAHIAALTSAR